MVAVSTDKRNLTRLPCSMALSEHSQSGLIGEIRNISLDGGFISTSAPLPKGSVFPLAFQLGADGPSIRAEAEVVRVDSDGMGVHFLTMSTKDARRLRRHVSDLVAVVGSRENAERLLDVDGRTTQPITDARKIAEILQPGEAPKKFILMPAKRVARQEAILSQVTDGTLTLNADQHCDLVAGEEVLVLHSHDFVSYFFRTTVRSVRERTFEIEVPRTLQYSERRASRREQTIDDSYIKFSVPWRKDETVAWNVVERTSHGLSFRANPKDGFFWPGTQLPDAVYCQEGNEEPLQGATVKHLTTMDEEDEPWLRVGISFGTTHARAAVTAATPESAAETFWSKLLGALHRGVSALEYYYHKKFRSTLGKADPATFSLVKFKNKAGKPVVGLLNTSFEQGQARSVRAPLVIIAPGFGGRKETMSALALTITHNFRRQHRDVAVMRFDGTNNLGESYKNPGCEKEGKHNLQFTFSDALDDLLGAVEWGKNNRHVDPTNIVIVSVSIGAVTVRRFLTMPEASLVSHWVSYHGAADASNAIMHGAGNIDIYGNFLRGLKTGIITLIGCMTDADYFSADAQKLRIATIDDARRDMAKVSAAVTWIVGKHDAYMDGNRVREVMSVNAPGDREIIEVDSGHVPRSSDEALFQFALITKHIWRRLYGRELDAVVPSRGWLAAMAASEWKRVRHGMPADRAAWWKDYLLGEGGLGFDAWALTPEYKQLVADQVSLLPESANQVLDLGAGTGNVSRALVARKLPAITALDLVPEALQRLQQKVGAHKVATVVASVEGTPRIAMARWLSGELGDLVRLADRLPATAHDGLERLATHCTSELHSILRGNNLPIGDALRRARLPGDLELIVRDVQTLARECRNLPPLQAGFVYSPAFNVVAQSAKGLPFAEGTFDAIVCSLVLSYIERPEDSLFEMRRILKPGGTLILSSMRPDADSSKAFMNSLAIAENLSEEDMPEGYNRERLLTALRTFTDHSSELVRLEEEGAFHFWEGETLARMLLEAGFESTSIHHTCGDPALAVIVKCTKR